MPDPTLDRILQELERDGFSLSTGLLSCDVLDWIESYFNLNLPSFSAAKIGQNENKFRQESVRGDYTFWIDPLNPPDAFTCIMDFLNKLKGAINQKFYLGLQQFECHLAYYPIGTFYRTHFDTFEKESSRQLSFVFYLNKEWEDQCGGELVLYNKDGSELSRIYPRPGSFICFLSSEFPHEVKSASLERRSFTGWMHRKLIY